MGHLEPGCVRVGVLGKLLVQHQADLDRAVQVTFAILAFLCVQFAGRLAVRLHRVQPGPRRHRRGAGRLGQMFPEYRGLIRAIREDVGVHQIHLGVGGIAAQVFGDRQLSDAFVKYDRLLRSAFSFPLGVRSHRFVKLDLSDHHARLEIVHLRRDDFVRVADQQAYDLGAVFGGARTVVIFRFQDAPVLPLRALKQLAGVAL